MSIEGGECTGPADSLEDLDRQDATDRGWGEELHDWLMEDNLSLLKRNHYSLRIRDHFWLLVETVDD